MKNFIFTIGCMFTLLLTACATTGTSENISIEEYEYFAKITSGGKHCAINNKADMRLVSETIAVLENHNNRYKQLLRGALPQFQNIATVRFNNSPLTQTECNEISMELSDFLASFQQHYDKEMRTIQSLRNTNQSIQYNKPIFCNTFGNFTSCF